MFFWSGIVFGLTGSLHCVGMCGPIALALPVGGATPPRKVFLIFLYNLGRAFMYALLGVVAGLIGTLIVISGYMQLLSVVAGVVIIVSAFFPVLRNVRFFSSFFLRLRETMSGIFARKEKKDLFVLGVLNGLLPCGLVYMALAVALAAGSVGDGALFMLLFGLGTFPLMMALPYAGSMVTEKMRSRFRKALPLMVAAMGVLLVLRGLNLGIPFVSPRFNQDVPPSCHQADVHSQHVIQCIGHASQATR